MPAVLLLVTAFFTGIKRPAQINPLPDGTYEVVYYPEVEGKCLVEVKYAGQPVPNRLVIN